MLASSRKACHRGCCNSLPMRTQHNVQVRQVVVLPAKNVAQVTADYRIGVSAANTICGIKRRGLDGLSSIFPRYGGLETILALRARGREYWPQREGGGVGGRVDWLPALPAHGPSAGCFVRFEESTGAARHFSTHRGFSILPPLSF